MRRIQCVLCGRYFSRISAKHLKDVHGITVKKYRSEYGPATPKEARALTTTSDNRSLLEAAMRSLSPEELSDMTASTRLRVFSQEKRHASVYAAFGMMEARLKHFQQTAALVEKIHEKLCTESWRLEMDQKGEAISTADLLKIVEYAQTDMKHASEVVMRVLNDVVQDNRAVVSRPNLTEQTAFTGDVDRIPVSGVPGHEREKIRVMAERIFVEVQRRQQGTNKDEDVIDGEGKPKDDGVNDTEGKPKDDGINDTEGNEAGGDGDDE